MNLVCNFVFFICAQKARGGRVSCRGIVGRLSGVCVKPPRFKWPDTALLRGEGRADEFLWEDYGDEGKKKYIEKIKKERRRRSEEISGRHKKLKRKKNGREAQDIWCPGMPVLG
jgi:hypothetical protein